MTSVYYYIIPFLRELERKYEGKQTWQYVRGNKTMEDDIELIFSVIDEDKLNEIPLKWLLYKSKGDIITETDASGKIGLGGYEADDGGICFKVRYADCKNWDPSNHPDILWLELAAAAILYQLKSKPNTNWKYKAIHSKVDNMALKHMMIKKRACSARLDCQQPDPQNLQSLHELQLLPLVFLAVDD